MGGLCCRRRNVGKTWMAVLMDEVGRLAHKNQPPDPSVSNTKSPFSCVIFHVYSSIRQFLLHRNSHLALK